MWRTVRTFDTREQAEALVSHLQAQHQAMREKMPTLPKVEHRVQEVPNGKWDYQIRE